MNQTVSRNEHSISEGYMAGEQGAIGDNIVIPQDRVVAYMAVSHQKVVVSNAGVVAEFVRPMDGDMLAENIVIPDREARGSSVVFYILRGISDHCSGMEHIVGADQCVARQMNMGTNSASRSEAHMCIDDCERSDLNRGIETCSRIDTSRWMNQAHLAAPIQHR